MKIIRQLFPKGITGKLIKFMIIFTFCMGFVFMTISRIQVAYLKRIVRQEDEKQTDLVQEEYRNSMSKFTEETLLQFITWATDKTDDEFWIMDHDMKTLGQQVEAVFRNPDNYAKIPISVPLKENAGKYCLQLLCPDGEENVSPKTYEMMQRLANLGPMMEEIVSGNVGYTMDFYIATTDGVALAMDDMPELKFDENGKIKSYDATTRPWYQKAVEKNDIYFSKAIDSFFYELDEVVFGLPVYVDGELVAVLEGSAKLDSLAEKLAERNIGKDGFSILVSNTGQLVCSTRTEGELRMTENLDSDIRTTVNRQLAELISSALYGETGVRLVQVDDRSYYAAYGTVDTVGWAQISFVSEQKILDPSNELIKKMDESTEDTIRHISKDFRKSVIVTVLITMGFMIIGILIGSFLAKKRVRPIRRMTKAVRGFVGEDMAFEMEDVYRTGDEIEVLAQSFETMSVRMKEYVSEIVEHTAEKERMQAELDAASNIQLSMLPKIEPDFYGKPEYELFAKMVPAKNVGGDLYDFFYLDEDHLAIVIGDVSGKGITAALFMALCKQMLKSQLLLHDGNLEKAMTESNLRLIEESEESMFITVWMGVVTLSTGVLDFVDAGHMFAAIKREGGDYAIKEDIHSMIVAGVKFAKYKLNSIKLNREDSIFLYTDGVTEANNLAGEMFGEKRLLQALNEDASHSVEETDNIVRRRISEFAEGCEQYDDITTLCFKYLGK